MAGLEDVIKAIKLAIVKAAYDMEAHAVRVVPVDTGRLKASIKVKAGNDYIILSADTEYDKYVEFGTVTQRPQPFITPALHAGIRKYIPNRIRQEIGRLR